MSDLPRAMERLQGFFAVPIRHLWRTLLVPSMGEAPVRPPLAWPPLLALGAIKLAVHLFSSGVIAYGYVGDEFYYLDCARRLDWGYVDHPPLSIALLAGIDRAFGDALLTLRLAPALAGCATLIVTALLTRELGGGRTAQSLAALSVLGAPVFLAMGSFYSMNAFEPALWTLAAWLLARILRAGRPSTWLWLGGVLGVGLLNKWSTAWLGIGIAVGLVLSPARRWLGTPWPWLAAVIAAVLWLPNLAWQIQHDWPTLEFMRRAAAVKNVPAPPLAFLELQLVALHPLIAPLWITGLVYLLFGTTGRRWRSLACLWLVPFGLLLASGSARAYHLAPAYPVLLAAGGRAIELFTLRRWRWLPVATGILLGVAAATGAPLALPLLPPEAYGAFEQTIGVKPPAETRDELGRLPLHFALRFHGPAVVDAVQTAFDALPEADRPRVRVLTESFHESGAINVLGARRGLPPAIGTHNHYWMWGPGDATGDILIVVAEPGRPILNHFESVERVAAIECEWCMPELRRKAVFLCRRPRRPLHELWPELKLLM